MTGKYRYLAELGCVHFSLLSNYPLNLEKILLPAKFVPGHAGIETTSMESDITFLLEHRENDQKPKLSRPCPRTFCLQGDINKMQDRLLYLLYTALECVRQEQGLCTVHAAAIALDATNSILVFGDKGSGKTSLCIKAIEIGLPVIGDDLIIVNANSMAISSGNRAFKIRSTGQNYDFFGKRIENFGSLDYGDRKISMVIRLSIHPYAAVHFAPLPQQKGNEVLRLYENTSRYISGVVTPLSISADTLEMAFPCFDGMPAFSTRKKIVNSLVAMPVLYLGANSAELAIDMIVRKWMRLSSDV